MLWFTRTLWGALLINWESLFSKINIPRIIPKYPRLASILLNIAYTDKEIIAAVSEVNKIRNSIAYRFVSKEINKGNFVPDNGIRYKKRSLTLAELEEMVKESEKQVSQFTITGLFITVGEAIVLYTRELSIILYKAFFFAFPAMVISVIAKQQVALQWMWRQAWASHWALQAWIVKYGSSCLDLVVYRPYYVLYRLVVFIDKMLIVKGAKYVINKAWFTDKTVNKFIKAVGTSFHVYGMSIRERFTIFVNGNIQKRSKVLYHKYDFVKELDLLNISLLEVVNALLALNKSPLIERLEEQVLLSEKNIEAIAFDYSKMFSLVPVSPVASTLEDLDCLNFSQSYFETANGLISLKSKLLEYREMLLNINTLKGYVVSRDIFDASHYPLISQVINFLITKEAYEKLNTYDKVSCFTWVTNVLMLRYYYICCKALNTLELNKGTLYNDEQYWKVLNADFSVMRKWYYSMLDNSIKQHLIKRNLTIYSDVVAGFDTEYVCEDWGINKLLSAQISSTNFLKLSIPLFVNFKFEGVNTHTSEVYLKGTPKFLKIDTLLNFITSNILASRSCNYKLHDEVMYKIANYFKKSKFQVAVTSSNMLVMLDKSVISNLFILPAEGEVLKVKFATLINLITANTVDRENSELRLVDKIKLLSYNHISSLFEGSLSSRFKPSWDANTMKNGVVKDIVLSNEENEVLSKEKSANAPRYTFSLNPRFILSDSEIDMISGSVLTSGEGQSPTGTFLAAPSDSSGSSVPSGHAESAPSKVEGELGGWENFEEVLNGNLTKIPININRRIFLAAHYNAADLTMIEDWESVSFKNVDIAKKCFTSLSTPMKAANEKVYLRDTILLASATAKSLEAIAYAYKLKKVDVSQHYKENMEILLRENPSLFKEYAMTDSLITLIHTLFINDFSFKLGSLNVPNTLGTLSSKYIKNKWAQDKYRGYQIDVNYPLGDARSSHTPKGIQFGKSTVEMSNLFIGSYRGGRNECFRYGCDSTKTWYDYDLVSCYSSIMAMMGNPDYEMTEEQRMAALAENIMPLAGQPDYNKARWISPAENIKELDLKQSYSAFKVKFCFPESILYPPFPVTLDKGIAIYPLTGETLVSGLELFSGMTMLNKEIDRLSLDPKHFYIDVLYGSFIPFKKELIEQPDGSKSEVMSYSPFKETIAELQHNRKIWKKETGKGSAMERIYKDLGNMLYGKIVCGISNKQVYDARTLVMKTMIGNDLSNPILGSWITGYVRALIAELLYETNALGGQIVSCTTDGFITDIENLEDKINATEGSLLREYQNIRVSLSGDKSALEVKTSVKGILQWTTRGQLSLGNEKTPVSAATGYQKSRNHQENVSLIKTAMTNGNKVLFLQKELTGAKDLYNTNKHVSMVTSKRNFRTVFDSKRIVLQSNESMLYTIPYTSVEQATMDRKLMTNLKQSVYSEAFSVFVTPPSKTVSEEVVKLFVRMVCIHYNYTVTVTLKNAFASIIHRINNKLSEKYVLELFTATELEKGNILTKVPVMAKSSEIVLALYNELKFLEDRSEVYVGLSQIFLETFNNYSVLPRTDEDIKQELLKNIKNLNAADIRVEYIDNKIIIHTNKEA